MNLQWNLMVRAGGIASLADEPTTPLEGQRALTVVRILNRLAQEYRTAIIVVTRDEKIIPTFKRICHIRDGRTVRETGEGRDIGV